MTDTPAPQTAREAAAAVLRYARGGDGPGDPGDLSDADYYIGLLSERGYTIVASDRLDFDAIAEDVRYGSAVTTDYWRGYNNGINALVSRLARSEAAEKGARG